MEWPTAIGWIVLCGIVMTWLLYEFRHPYSEPDQPRYFPLSHPPVGYAIVGTLVCVWRRMMVWPGAAYSHNPGIAFDVDLIGFGLPRLIAAMQRAHPELSAADVDAVVRVAAMCVRAVVERRHNAKCEGV